ncbi:MAG: radical SAM protein [Magnetococcales bacterium]|nr:radical SAM protein [Magnetococcales bacterium]
MLKKSGKSVYEKHDSFATFVSNQADNILQTQKARAVRILKLERKTANSHDPALSKILQTVQEDLSKPETEKKDFNLSRMSAEEMVRLDDKDLPKYLYHRYRYQVFPKKKHIDAYPPYVQIEPTSICNYRCIFCYQTNPSFSNKKHGFMGSMTLPMFKNIVDQLLGNVEFISISSRGEPFICKDIVPMLEYCVDKFLSLKLNSNASLLTEEIAHAILAGGVQTCSFSVDAVDAELYSRMRVNGDLQQVIKNIEMFQEIKVKHYPDSKIITRISGVYADDQQDFKSMVGFLGSLVDQITFVSYNPWQNIYDQPANCIDSPCSDLWRRVFLWHNGQANPCENDHKSTLSVGSLKDDSITELWQSSAYAKIREAHSAQQRQQLEPCKKCTFT